MTHPKRLQDKRRAQHHVLEDGLPSPVQSIDGRDDLIKSLQETIEVLKEQIRRADANIEGMQRALEDLSAVQYLSNRISMATDQEQLVSALIELTGQLLPLRDSALLLFGDSHGKLVPLSPKSSMRLLDEAQRQSELGIVERVIAGRKGVMLPHHDATSTDDKPMTLMILPLFLRREAIGIYVIKVEKSHQEITEQQVQLLAVIANQAAVGIGHLQACQALMKADGELRASQVQMMQAAKLAAIGELAGDIAHEMTNPLQVMMLHLELVQSGRASPNRNEMFLAQMQRLSDVTARLKEFARNASSRVTMGPLDLNATVMASVDVIRHEFTDARIQVDVASCEAPLVVVGNTNYIQQVILNLLLNARDAMPEGGIVKVTISRSDDLACVRVADTGPGVPKNIQGRIFKPFFTTKGDEGAGLGLAICSKIVAQHGGKILLESEEGKGAAFTVCLPLHLASE